MADIASLIKALKDTAVAQYGKGAPYREALASALKGDMSGVNQALSKSELTPADFAGFVGSIKGVGQLPILDTLNPTGIGSKSGLHADYNPEIRASQPLAEHMVSIDKTMGGHPDDIITIYRGAPKHQKSIVPGDFITDMPELAKAYTGDNNVLALKVRKGDVLDNINEPLGNEYLYRPNADKK